MGANVTGLKDTLEKFITRISEGITQIEKNVTNEIVDALLEGKAQGGTPKLSGHLRSNYIVSTDEVFNDVIGSKKQVDKSKREASRLSFNSKKDLIRVDHIYINNNVPYGPIVNSDQRFREESLKRGINRLKGERI